MAPPLPCILSAVPQTLQVRLEIAKAVQTLAAANREEQRPAEASQAGIDSELIKECASEFRKEFLSLVRRHLEKRRNSVVKAAVDDPKHPGWPAHTPGGKGGQFRPKNASDAAVETRLAGDSYYPPVPRGYDPDTWKQGRWPNNGKYFLEDPEANKYTVHPEDDKHWRHWDKQDSDGNDQGRSPPNSKKPWPGQKNLKEDQSDSDPNGDAPPWTPSPYIPIIPVDPIPLPEFPILSPLFVPG